MKTFLSLLLSLLISSFCLAQDKYMTRTGHISFLSDAPKEKIEAHNYQVSSILTSAGDIIFKVPIKSFEFKQALMQDHFNENYMESDKYPQASFKGKILNMDKIDLKKDGKQMADVEGEITMHGVTKKINTKATLDIKGGKVKATTTFPVTLKEYNIIVPKVASEKLQETVQVTADLNYEHTK
ncbi:MAG TPA: YceI family protein [Cytophagaceae bacterium]|jgi:polyisoprenoid-binding protein YceI|nr:YceI family protein [Cytophagaceae bacterium]